MRIIRKSWNGSETEVSISSMIEAACAADDVDGVAERARSVADKTAHILGKIVEALHRNGALRDHDVAEHAPHNYTAHTETASVKQRTLDEVSQRLSRMKPDTSATAQEHHVGLRAGHHQAVEAVIAMLQQMQTDED